MQITKPTIADIPQLLPLWEEQYKYHHSLDSVYYVPYSKELTNKISTYLLKAIEKDEPHILIAKENNEMAAFITFEQETEEYFDTQIKKYGVVIELYISALFRRKGIGKALMEAAEEQFLQMGISDVKVASSSANDVALSFYEDLGYKNRQTLLYKKIR